MAGLDDLQKLLDNAAKVIPGKLPSIIEVEGLNFIKKNFRDEGFNDGSKKAWEKRQTERDGRDLTRYKTNRVGTAGSLNKFGQREQGRAILVGHNTGGNKLRNSFRARKNRQRVVFYSYKKYAQRHNEGLDGMPKRQFMGMSKTLEDNIKKKLTRELDKALKK